METLMKTIFLSFRSCRWLLAFGLLLLFGNSLSASPEDQPVINSILLERTNVVVTVQVPAGIRRVTLECRSRLGHELRGQELLLVIVPNHRIWRHFP